jgi:hypothetical protein
VAVMDFDSYLEWHNSWVKDGGKRKRFPKYEALVEVKMVWRGLLPQKDGGRILWNWGGVTNKQKNAVEGIKNDLRKLSGCLDSNLTKKAHLILLDSTQEKGVCVCAHQVTHALLGLRFGL